MRFLSFRIKNFRGVQDATIDLTPSGAGIFTLIGLNESGKTTVLEAIGSFQITSSDEKSLYQNQNLTRPVQIDPATYVPKHEKATFTGDITVTAVIEFDEASKNLCIEHAEKQGKVKLDRSAIPDKFTVTRGHRFKDGDFVERINTWGMVLRGKGKGARSFKNMPSDSPCWRAFSAMVALKLPEIIYFPTFLFEQPEKIVLNPLKGEKPADRVYRKIIENIGASLDRPIDVGSAIVDRIIKPEVEGGIFSGLFGLSTNRQQQIESAIGQLSRHLSVTVLSRWSKIFGGSTSDKEVWLRLGVDKHPDETPRVYVQFNLRDGTEPYDISERSLGFRWFFSFLLFTLYRAANSWAGRRFFCWMNLHLICMLELKLNYLRVSLRLPMREV